jgi:hypothetical protein
MNTQVHSETSAGHAAPTVAVAETAPVALTPVAAAVTTTPAAHHPVVAKNVLDDFLDADDEIEVAPAVVGLVDEQSGPAELDTESATFADEGDTIAEFEDGASAEAGDADEADADQDLEGLVDLEEAVGEEEQSMVVIDVFKKKCTDCTHLVPWGTKTHKRCHFSNGNDLCPAQSVRVRRYIPVDQIVSRFLAAEAQGDTDRLVTLYENLKSKATDVQEEIHAALKAAREKKALKAATV